ncbi:MAG: hypothetical protein SFV22_13215 [Saprospiraceae bacterium]|nr:hypothetical protein [Saprospiraceae bacterium]
MKNFIFLFLFLWGTAAFSQSTVCPGPSYPGVFNSPPSYYNDEFIGPYTPPPPDPFAGDLRGIYWVHGFGGDLNSLAQVKEATDEGAGNTYPARKTVGLLMTYSTTGLPAAGSTLNDNILASSGAMQARGVTDFSRNFIIAHSQGGIVSRWADMELENDPPSARNFYGIATFGSPHQGANIVNSRNNGLINELAHDACESVLSTGAAALFKEKPIIAFFLDLSDINESINELCTDAPDAILPFALSKFFSGVSNGYAVGATELGELNGYASNVHQAAFHGIEFAKPHEDPSDNGFTSKQLIWRTLGSPPDDVSNAPVFSANQDQDLVDWANKLMAEYQAKYELHAQNVENLGGYCDWWDWALWPLFCITHDPEVRLQTDLRNLYHNAWRWSQGVDRQWKIIIGGLDIQDVGTYKCFCDNDPTTPTNATTQAECLSNEDDHCSWRWISNVQEVIRPSDGVVLAGSASAWGGTSMRLNYANHFQLRNSEQTKDALLNLFTIGGAGFDDWFITDEK